MKISLPDRSLRYPNRSSDPVSVFHWVCSADKPKAEPMTKPMPEPKAKPEPTIEPEPEPTIEPKPKPTE